MSFKCSLVLILFLIDPLNLTPIKHPEKFDSFSEPSIDVTFCQLPPELEFQGNVTYVEDCPSLELFDKVPMPGSFFHKIGTHPVVCCPRERPASVICFESDAYCPTYEEITYPPLPDDQYDDDFPQYDVITYTQLPTLAERSCSIDGAVAKHQINETTTWELAECVSISRCPAIFEVENSIQTLVTSICGFDEDEKLVMVCCPSELTSTSNDGAIGSLLPRYPVRNKARTCEDKVDSKLCRKWQNNGGCDLDKDIIISELDPDNGKVTSLNLFDFMQTTCLDTCGLCGRKGCVDEHPECQAWARSGMCVVNPLFMAHTCRESCGVCGFLSPDNKDEQIDNEGNSYSDFTRRNFDCGRLKPLCEINEEDCDEDNREEDDNDDATLADEFDLRQAKLSDDVFFSSTPDPNNPEKFFCGATIISDRWVVAAAHCYDNFGNEASGQSRKVTVNTIRDNTKHKETIEMKRVYKHPLYQFPNLYNDVAVIELGRRIEFDWDQFGDSPTCIDQGQRDNVGRVATIQGYGLTEFGVSGQLLETNVTVITNKYCKEILQHNGTQSNIARGLINNAIPFGLDYGLMCAQGEQNDEGIFSGSCEGDSGGPLFTTYEEQKQTLIGIVSGGVGCGKGYPGWYTRVAYYKDWIQCIVDGSIRFNNHQSEIQEHCSDRAIQPPDCEDLPDDIQIFDDVGSAEENCKTYLRTLS